jgi:hypothetical protein
MSTKLLLMGTLALASVAAYAADVKPDRPVDVTAAFARLQSLAGEWQADTQMGKVRVTYEPIAGGTALVAREKGDKMPEMLTVFHLDNGRLLLTHYCMAGNQPRMQAQSFNPATGELKFQFLDATNLSSPAAGHMRNATFKLVDHTHLIEEWQFYENGGVKQAETAQYTRVR